MHNGGTWDHSHELLAQENLQCLCQDPGIGKRSQSYSLLDIDSLPHASFSKTSSFDCGLRFSHPLEKLRLLGQRSCLSGPGRFCYKFPWRGEVRFLSTAESCNKVACLAWLGRALADRMHPPTRWLQGPSLALDGPGFIQFPAPDVELPLWTEGSNCLNN